MFVRRDLLPHYDLKDQRKYKNRWQTPSGRKFQEKILKMIRDGAGEDILQWDFEGGRLGILESGWDLRGLVFSKEDIVFPKADNFSKIDFSYASFYHSKLRNATFFDTVTSFARVYNCQFVDCVFSSAEFYGTTFQKVKFINCAFVGGNSFTNCEFRDVQFQGCFVSNRVFFDCRFDEETVINDPPDRPLTLYAGVHNLDRVNLVEIYKGIKDAYAAGAAFEQARKYLFKERSSITRYNSKALIQKAKGLFLEIVAGYGLKPLRVLIAMLIMFAIFSLLFMFRFGIWDGLFVSAGAFFTFGAKAQSLEHVC
jgi:uncharacterized protein YjbI with pentapeptide repeats